MPRVAVPTAATAVHGGPPLAVLVDVYAVLYRLLFVWQRLQPRPPGEAFLRCMVPRYLTNLRRVAPGKGESAAAAFLALPGGAPRPRALFCCFDQSVGGRYARSDVLPGYKAHRLRSPDHDRFISRGVEEVRGAGGVRCLPSLALADECVEADDIIAALAGEAHGRDQPCLIVSHDKDLYQLVSDARRVAYYHLGKKRFVDEAGVRRQMGVEPRQVGDYLALLGDVADNVAGVPGVGVVRARGLLQRYGSLEGVAAAVAVGEVRPPGVAAALAAHGTRSAMIRDHVIALRPPAWAAGSLSLPTTDAPELPLRDVPEVAPSSWRRVPGPSVGRPRGPRRPRGRNGAEKGERS